MLASIEYRSLKVLDFDCECRPLAWYGGDFVTKQPTAIAWLPLWKRSKTPEVAVIGESGDPELLRFEEEEMLDRFREAYDEADVVTGHFIRGFDLPLLDGAMMRLGLVSLGDKLSQDTKLDLVKSSGISKSQENLGAMFELEHPKVSMNTTLWAEGNMLTAKGIAITKKRVVGDVKQHTELREVMLERGLLAKPSLWNPDGGRGPVKYHA